jgi:hypothetical protein
MMGHTARAAVSSAEDLRDREPFLVLGVMLMPQPAPSRENPFWPAVVA